MDEAATGRCCCTGVSPRPTRTLRCLRNALKLLVGHDVARRIVLAHVEVGTTLQIDSERFQECQDDARIPRKGTGSIELGFV